MKEYKVELTIDEDVLKSLEQEIVAKKIVNSFFGPSDEFLFLIVKGWKERRSRLHITTKKKEKKDSKTKPKRQASTGSKQSKGRMNVTQGYKWQN